MVEPREILQFAERLARAFRPERVILFGSYAYGDPCPDSDVDLFVIMPFRGSASRVAADITERIPVGFPVDLLVRTAENVRSRLQGNDFFVKEVIESGITLYDASNPRMGARLSKAAVEVRYPGFGVTKTGARAAFRTAGLLREAIRKSLGLRV